MSTYSQSTVILDTVSGSKHTIYVWNGKASIEGQRIELQAMKYVIVDSDTLITENRLFSVEVSPAELVTIFSGLLPAVVTEVKQKAIIDAKLENLLDRNR